MNVTIRPSRARGTVAAPPSKSMAHRLLISAALSEGESTVRGISASEDMGATLDCLAALGASYTREGDTVRIRGFDPRTSAPTQPLLPRESGSTLRFMIPIAMLSGNTVTLRGAPSLMQRPMGIYETLCREKHMTFLQNGQEITVRGALPAGEYRVAGNVSSQFISGLLFALPLTHGESMIRITPPVESRSYIELTRAALRDFGVTVEWTDDCTLHVAGNQHYRAHDVTVEGDYSNAAFLDALGYLGGDVTVTGLSADSLQGDRVYRQHFQALAQGTPTISIGDCPDLGPILSALAAAGKGATFTGTRRLRIKESDRVLAMEQELKKFGTALRIGEDTVKVIPTAFHAPVAPLDGHNDHRIVMSMAVLCSLTGGEITGAEAVAKSFPDFFDKIRQLGVSVETESH